MALATSNLRPCSMCFNGPHLKSAISFEAEQGYKNAYGRKMSFSNFLYSMLSKLRSRSRIKFTKKLLEKVNSYGSARTSDRSKLPHKVSVLMGHKPHNIVHDLIENGRARRESSLDPKDVMDEFDASLASKRFPSITFGSSSVIELYDGTSCQMGRVDLLPVASCDGFLPSSLEDKWSKDDAIRESWSSLDHSVSKGNSSSSSSLDDGNSYMLASHPQSMALEDDGNSDSKVVMEESLKHMGVETQQNGASVELILDKPISCLPGLSKKLCHQLEKCGIYTTRKLLHLFPRTYADLQNPHGEIDDGNYLIFFGKVSSSRGIKAGAAFSFLEVVVVCEMATSEVSSEPNSDDLIGEGKKIYLHLKKFYKGARFTNRNFLLCLQSKHQEGDLVCVSGKVRIMPKKDHYEMREYNIDVLEDEKKPDIHGDVRPYPLYPSKGGMNPALVRDIISRALQSLSTDIDPLPKDICEEFGLLTLHHAYRGIHHPKDLKEADLARRRLIFDDFFYLQLGRLFQMLDTLGTRIEKDGLLDKYQINKLNVLLVEEWSSLTTTFLKALPYSLTPSQLNAVSEIIWDLKQPVPMYRLLQGDVGCGKTVVAFLACMEVIGSGYQAAFMVPTELLAVQHYEHLMSLLENIEDQRKPSVALLTGSTPSKQSRLIRKGLLDGDISLVIGTHSLTSENVEFSALRIAVVDEQHRFGVIQRGKFNSKLYYASANSRLNLAKSDGSSENEVYMAPHVLAMTATPIPRTLALALYGDMTLTQITDLPPGRIPIETYIFEGNDKGFEDVYQMMWDELQTGGKIYLVYPVIEESEQLPQLRAASADLETISSKFKGYQCGLLHGRMRSDDKDEALRMFRSGETKILLSTLVIEIGVDVPDASMMVVMNAERFGMAQLHQLRGRVGRGQRKSKCIFLASTSSSLSRLKVLETSSDGFHLANVDLSLRGPGDLLGKKQSGHLPEFPIARLEIDGNIIQEAHLAALKILGTSHDLKHFPKLKAELSMREPLCLLGD
ncbi:ATP-dependent DNA helicase homolog RECG, chloroplastic isoform X1 [Telopea speciosissima]|uniref:ATP-dependent DNA helicase homolog RECG, chloroplastic isoform X1 n=1 Tax=Telopea speciosissima TaxID=54955 RepID=UPI001CC41CCB|nr:ATP-dependent DNA helicase homolog RECG, chloroplastic isoform X1 [Telopea speciosissima]XP_043693970.1 ATP-dependent DNA helicase homolog RECG, chloroplastic isoform X1 [Telopea speciosissima]